MENTEKSAAPTPTGGGGAKEKIEKQARQLAYDVRYKVRGALKAQSGGKSDPATVKKAYLAQLGKSPSNPAVKTRAKQMLMGEDYININKVVAQGVASAMYKVFVEHHQTDSDGNVIPHEETSPLNNGHKNDITEDKAKEKTYKVRVTDKESGNSYVRNATRAKIAELRNNPNISSVEMTEYGEVTKSEKHKGSQTASVKSGKGVDYDGDGKVESGSKEHAGVVHNAIQKKKGGKADGQDTRKESTLHDLTKVYLNQAANVSEHHKKDEDGNTIPHEDEVTEAMSSYDKARKAAARRAADRNAARRRGEMGGRMERETYTNEAGTRMHHKGYRANANEGRTYTWRDDINLREVMTDDGEQKEVTEKKVKNKIKINPKLGEAIEEIGGEVLEAYTVTNADKKGNTPAYQGYKAGKKNVKTGKPMYKAADHMKEEDDINEKISASGYARAKKYREDQAREKDRKEQEYFANKAKTHKWDGEKWNKREKVKEELQVDEGIGDMAIKAIEKTNPPHISKRSEMMRKIKLNQLKSYLKKQDEKKKKAASKGS